MKNHNHIHCRILDSVLALIFTCLLNVQAGGSDGSADPRVSRLQVQVDNLDRTVSRLATQSALPMADRPVAHPTTLEELIQIERYLLRKYIAVQESRLAEYKKKYVSVASEERNEMERRLADLKNELSIVDKLAQEFVEQKKSAQQRSGPPTQEQAPKGATP